MICWVSRVMEPFSQATLTSARFKGAGRDDDHGGKIRIQVANVALHQRDDVRMDSNGDLGLGLDDRQQPRQQCTNFCRPVLTAKLRK